VNVRDGRRDVVRCGRGEDVATADDFDVLIDCEHVARPPAL
jgi:hypothetical protein